MEKNDSPNNAFFDCVFLSISGGFGEGLGRVLRGVWRVLAPLGPPLARPFSVLLFGMGSGRAPGASGARFGMDFEGLGRGPGGVLEINLRVLEGLERLGPSWPENAPSWLQDGLSNCSFLAFKFKHPKNKIFSGPTLL